MGKKKRDDDEPTPTQRAIKMGLIGGGAFIGIMLLLDAGLRLTGGKDTLTGRIGIFLAVGIILVLWWRGRRNRRQ